MMDQRVLVDESILYSTKRFREGPAFLSSLVFDSMPISVFFTHNGEVEGWQTYRVRRKRNSTDAPGHYGGSKWSELEVRSHTVFVDGLPNDIAKRTLYKIFGWAGYVTDIYVSRKKRRGTNKLFAFVRGLKGLVIS
ncbi:hypothetical protein PIB30_008279 [Stylosanthes scabra]|uniref:RRM domain-containing protein n=1 Tax=Stylosanthes scabra TaxID=79078 RepID=A0ABU6R4W3_9FABA|nr:hypothetical protein [Stylosanthes scabra]